MSKPLFLLVFALLPTVKSVAAPAPTRSFPPIFIGSNGRGERLELARCGTKWRLLYQVNRARPVDDLPDVVEAEVHLPDGV